MNFDTNQGLISSAGYATPQNIYEKNALPLDTAQLLLAIALSLVILGALLVEQKTLRRVSGYLGFSPREARAH